MNYIVGTLHILPSIILGFYVLFFQTKSYYDKYYLAYWFLVVYLWTLLNGECIITYYDKLKNDPHYFPGKDVLHNSDVYFLPFSKKFINTYILSGLYILMLINLFIIMKRNRFSNTLTIILILLFIIYKVALYTHDEHYKNESFLKIQQFTTFALTCSYMYILYKWKKGGIF